MQTKLRITVVGVLTVCFVLVGVLTGHSTTVEKMNVARLIEHSELILVGQVVGMMNEIRSTREVIFDLVQEYVDAVESLNELNID